MAEPRPICRIPSSKPKRFPMRDTPRLRPQRASSRGNAFLEILMVAAAISGIILSVTLGINALANSSLSAESAVRGSYAHAIALMGALDRDFSEADQVLLVEGRTVTKGTTNNPWTNSTNFRAPEFVPGAGYTADNAAYRTALTNTNSAPIGLTNSTTQKEIHFLKGGNIISVLTYNWQAGATNTATFSRYSPNTGGALGAPTQMSYFSVTYTNSPDLSISNLVVQLPFGSGGVADRGYFNIELPNPRDLGETTVKLDPAESARTNMLSSQHNRLKERLILIRTPIK